MLNGSFLTNSYLKKYQPLINEINSLEKNLTLLTDSELRAEKVKLKKCYKDVKKLDQLITMSFALTREASVRTLGLRHFDAQLMGGLVLNDRKIAEMKPGEGKTLVATLPASLNALTQRGVHIITVNDYLANRDQVAMSQIYKFLGLSTGLIQTDMPILERKLNYGADITYVTNYEVGFDFLKDHLALNIDDIVLKTLNYCIIDEVDSILIDEAQMPLIVSNTTKTPFTNYIIAAEITDYLKLHKHYKIDQKNKNIILTEIGCKKIEKILGIHDLYNPLTPWIIYIINSLKAKVLYFKNIHYIVQNNQIIIVDEFTGRIMPDRRWGDGLHQAIEAKEKVEIQPITEIIASITYQNLFLLYSKLSGMTGTGKTSEIEFEKIYGMPVQVIPTVTPNKRMDLPDLIYKDQISKWTAVAKECNNISVKGQPILIGTKSVEKSEMLAQFLNSYELKYRILNAKPENIKNEAEIVAQAGKKNSITIATNIAGRGTDIILGGNVNFKMQKSLYNILTFSKQFIDSKNRVTFFYEILKKFQGISHKILSILLSLLNDSNFLPLSNQNILLILRENNQLIIPKIPFQWSINHLIKGLCAYGQKHHSQDNKIVRNLGGLYIIGTERNDSRRIDNQLRGRCGRQGDPGISRFFLSLDDSLLKLFGSSRIQKFTQNQLFLNSSIESVFVTKSIDLAQGQVEEYAYHNRKNLLEYDSVLNKQRSLVYNERQQVLQHVAVKKNILGFGEQVITDILLELWKNPVYKKKILIIFKNLFGRSLILNQEYNLKHSVKEFDFYELKLYLFDEFWLAYQLKKIQLSIYGNESIEHFEKICILLNIDKNWKEYLEKLTLLKEFVGWRGYGHLSPLDEYKKDSRSIFETGEKLLRYNIVYDLLRSFVQ